MRPSPPWPGRRPSGSVVLPLPWSFVPPLVATLDLPEVALARKDELHFTLLGSDEARRAARTTGEDRWRDYFRRHDWTLRLTDRWFLLQAAGDERTVRSVVAEVDCPALNAFRRELGHAAAIDLPETLPHVTLWVAGGTTGIGLASMAEFAAKTVRALDIGEREAGIAVG